LGPPPCSTRAAPERLSAEHELQEPGEVVRRGIGRQPELLGRPGGEEFAVLLPGSNQSQAYVVAERIRASFAENCRALGGHVLNATVSAGVFTAHWDGTVDELMALADKALYRAKAGGRNRVEYDDRLAEPAPEASDVMANAA
jgi:diguanylate cyclase (GGDEF)-like protein